MSTIDAILSLGTHWNRERYRCALDEYDEDKAIALHRRMQIVLAIAGKGA